MRLTQLPKHSRLTRKSCALKPTTCGNGKARHRILCIRRSGRCRKFPGTRAYGAANPRYFTKVAILDTGVDAMHPDLTGVVTAGYSVIDGSNGLTDENGHGTW